MLGLAQADDFGFVLTVFIMQQNILPMMLSDRLILIVMMSILMTRLRF